MHGRNSRNKGHIWNDATNEDFLTFLGAAGKDSSGILRPTYAGMFMFGLDCWITRALPNYFLDYRQETSFDVRWEDRFVSFSGDWSGNIYDFYVRVYNKLKAALKVPFKLDGIERVDDTPAHEALREAIVNCVTNADYHTSRGIVCLWRDDALVIANPGGFRIPIEKAFQPGESNPRNATLLKMFAMIDAGERAGSGISKIFHGWMEAGYAAPSYEEEFSPDRTILKLPLFTEEKTRQNNPSENPVRITRQKNPSGKMNGTNYGKTIARKQAIVGILSKGPAKSQDIAHTLGLSVTRTNEILREMIREGEVIPDGETRSRQYRLEEKP